MGFWRRVCFETSLGRIALGGLSEADSLHCTPGRLVDERYESGESPALLWLSRDGMQDAVEMEERSRGRLG